MKKSLSETLTLFYPLAGKTVDNMMIDCNDNGALFVEAKVDISMSSFLQQPDGHQLSLFLPTEIESNEETTGFFTLVQLSFFTCGGVAIGVCISHKLGDANTVLTFMKSWAENLTGDFSDMTIPVYEAAALFPSKEVFINREVRAPDVSEQSSRLVLKRLVFDQTKLRLTTQELSFKHKPSKSEIVTAIIWKSALNAARSNRRSSSRHSVMSRAVDIRRRISPPLTPNSIGNVMGFHNAVMDGTEVDLLGLVGAMREGLRVFDEKFVKKLQAEEDVVDYLEEFVRETRRDDVETYISSSLCNMPLYDVDFGWGRPVWVTVPLPDSKKGMMVMDSNRGDGSVEAWVVLVEEDMYLLERDPELLGYASVNSSVHPGVKSSL